MPRPGLTSVGTDYPYAQTETLTFELREREIDTQARERERALADSREHLLSLSKALSREQTLNQSRERRIIDLEGEVAQCRQQLGTLIAGAIAARPPRRARKVAKSAYEVRVSSPSKKSGPGARSEPAEAAQNNHGIAFPQPEGAQNDPKGKKPAAAVKRDNSFGCRKSDRGSSSSMPEIFTTPTGWE